MATRLLDPTRGTDVAGQLRALGAKNKTLLRAAELGYITELRCAMPRCFCPEELGGPAYFEPVTAEVTDWSPTMEHFPVAKRDGGRTTVDNAILAHRLCNRLDYSLSVGRPHARDLERIERARRGAGWNLAVAPDTGARLLVATVHSAACTAFRTEQPRDCDSPLCRCLAL
jgi:hypothetical protein